MKLVYYPENQEPGCEGYVRRFLRKDLNKRYDLRTKVDSFFKKIVPMKDLGPFFRSEHLASLGGGLNEMRIPPVADGGVVRIYYCEDSKDSSTLVLLDAELKHGKEPSRRDTARKRMAEYSHSCKRRDENERR